jgi:hypothetical protein
VSVATLWQRHYAVDDTERLLREEIARQHDLHALTLRELDIQREKATRWQEHCRWAYQVTSDALMVSAQKPREARAARDNAISEVNKKLGGLVR